MVHRNEVRRRKQPLGRIAQIQAGAFLADGRRVVLCASEAGKGSRLYLQDIEDGEPRPLGEAGSVSAFNATIPSTRDGSFVVASDRDGRLELLSTSVGVAPRPIAASRPGDRPLQA